MKHEIENHQKSGIYVIFNFLKNKFYIGSTSNFERRFREHKCSLDKSVHHNRWLQTDYETDKNYISFFVLENIDSVNLFEREQEYLDVFFDYQKKCYNSLSKARALPDWYKEIYKENQSFAAKQRWIRDREKIINQRNNNEYKIKFSLATQHNWSKHILINPEGNQQEIVNLSKFARDNGYNKSCFVKLLNGKITHYRGWTLPGTKLEDVQFKERQKYWDSISKEYEFIDPNGNLIKFKNLRKFCKENGFNSSVFNCLSRGKIKSCYGYTLPPKEE